MGKAALVFTAALVRGVEVVLAGIEIRINLIAVVIHELDVLFAALHKVEVVGLTWIDHIVTPEQIRAPVPILNPADVYFLDRVVTGVVDAEIVVIEPPRAARGEEAGH
jgi:hypothetical protein